jgi:hypothetical protein
MNQKSISPFIFFEKGVDKNKKMDKIWVWFIVCTTKGGEIMTNTNLLEIRIANSGKKKGYLAEKIGLSSAGFRNCITNKSEFRVSQVEILCDELGITSLAEREQIFFAKSGSYNAPL